MLGLYAREVHGVGQYLETTMLASTAHVMSPHLVRWDGAPDWQLPDAGQHGVNALYRLYPCRRGWIFVGVVQPRERRALEAALGLAISNDDATLAAAVAGVATAEDASSLAVRLQRAGVPAVTVSDVTPDAWLESHELLDPATHRQFGDYWRPPAKVHVGDLPHRLGPAAAVGEHSRALLDELGYGDAEIERLLQAGVVGAPGTGSIINKI
jgi:crotonobetainyl-CoA:carnitine CoA-transferase CaiB-like acyl-CoA transferase